MKKLSSYDGREVIVFGRNYINVIGQIRSFGEAGHKCVLVWVKEDAHTPKESRYVETYHEVKNVNEGMELILSLYGNNPKKNIISTDNDEIVTLLNANRERIEDKFFYFGTNQNGMMQKAMQKEYQCALAQRHNMGIPKSEIVKVGEMPHELKYPIITKVLDSTDYKHWKGYQVVCENEGELLNAYQTTFADFGSHDKILLQEFVEKQNELQVEGVSLNGGEEIFLPIQVLSHRQHKNGYGTFKYAEQYHYGDELINNIQALLKDIGYTGVFEVEYLVGKDNKLYFLEINLRYTLFNYLMTRMGVNLADVWASSVISGRLKSENVKISSTPKSVIYEDRDFQLSVLHGDLKCGQWVSDFIKSDCYLILNRKDWKPVLFYLVRRVAGIVRRKIR